jgi:hypothetical protein
MPRSSASWANISPAAMSDIGWNAMVKVLPRRSAQRVQPVGADIYLGSIVASYAHMLE